MVERSIRRSIPAASAMAAERSPAFSRTLWFAAVVLLMLGQMASAQDSGPSKYWFEREALNEGLPPPSRYIDRDTPRSALESFIIAHRTKDWADAAHVLDLSELSPEEQTARGAELARKLAEVVERRIWVSWSDLPERPDGIIEAGGDSNPMVGVVRRSIRIGVLDLPLLPVTVRFNRVKPEDGEPVWVFAPSTVAHIEALHDHHGPGWLENMLPEDWKQSSYASLQRWEWLALPVALVAVVLTFFIVRSVIGWIAGRTPTSLGTKALREARTPTAIVAAAALGKTLVQDIATFSAPVTTIATPIFLGLIVLGLAMAAVRAIDAVLNVVTHRYVGEIDDEHSSSERRFYTQIYALRRIVLLVAVLVGTGIVLTQLHLLENIGFSLLASAGVLTIILGIAGQTVLGNIISSLQIALAKPIRIGDSVNFEGDWAYVESIFYTFVRLRTWDDRRLVVPVQYFVSTPFENWSVVDAKMTRTFYLKLDHNADVDELRDVFLDMAKKDDDVMQDEMLKVLVLGHSLTGIDVRLYATAADPSGAWNMHARLQEQMIAWIRDNRPEWWPREREVQGEGAEGRRD